MCLIKPSGKVDVGYIALFIIISKYVCSFSIFVFPGGILIFFQTFLRWLSTEALAKIDE